MYRIGSLDITAIMGVSPYDTPISLYLKKKGKIPKKIEETFQTKVGKKIEPLLREMAFEIYGISIKGNDFNMRACEDEPRFISVPDGFTLQNGEPIVCELKTRGYDNQKLDFYELQTRWHMMVCKQNGLLVIMTGLHSLDIFELQRDLEIEGEMRQRAYYFLDCLENDRLPEEQFFSPITLEALKKVKPEKETIELPPEKEDMFKVYFELSAKLKELEKQVDEAKQAIILSMFNYKKAVCGNYEAVITQVSRKPQLSVPVDYKEQLEKMNIEFKESAGSEYNQFRIREIKK